MRFLLALALCQLVASTFALNLFTFNKVKYLDDLDIKPPIDSVPGDRKRSPVILVPGDGGSRLDAELDKTSVVHYACEYTTSMFFDIWLNKLQMVPWIIDCWADNLRLVYNNDTRQTSNSPGVTIRVPGWGYAETVEWIDTSHSRVSAYYVNLGNALVQTGYQRGLSIRSAPYDFRKAPDENINFPIKMRYLVEETYEINGNTPVTLIVHSYGAPMTLFFLHQQSQEWKDKYIKRMISLAGAWGGSMKSLKTYVTGDELDNWLVDHKAVRRMLSSTPSLAYLMPNSQFWKPDQVLVSTAKRSYTVEDIKDFYMDIDHPDGWEMYQNVQPYARNFTPPGVEVYCFYGSDKPTVERLDYGSSAEISENPTIVNGNGDGTVNQQSLEACQNWVGQQDKPVYYQKFPGVDHMGILADKEVLQNLADIQNGS